MTNDGVREALRTIIAVLGNVNHDTPGGENAAALRGGMLESIREIATAALSGSGVDQAGGEVAFQARVDRWLLACFGEEIARDPIERNHRFLEEALELVQSLGCTASEAHQLVDYVFSRPPGEPSQEVGGSMNTLAALCLAHGLDMLACGNTEMTRIETPDIMAKVRAKQAAKPKHSPLPAAPSGVDQPTSGAEVERLRELSEKATQGPWIKGPIALAFKKLTRSCEDTEAEADSFAQQDDADAAFAVACVNHVRASLSMSEDASGGEG